MFRGDSGSAGALAQEGIRPSRDSGSLSSVQNNKPLYVRLLLVAFSPGNQCQTQRHVKI